MTEATVETPPAASDSPTRADIDKLNAALAKERDARKEAERKAREGSEAQKRLDEIEAANASETDKAIKAAVAEATATERARTAGILATAEARALAATAKFRDVSDAVAFLNLADVKVGEDGAVDSAAIQTQLEALAKQKPYLLAEDKPEIPAPGAAGIGVTGTGGQPTNPKAADIAQIEADLAATRRGR